MLKHVVLISGGEGSGKTHWALQNTPTPHYIVDTEGGHNLHTAHEADPKLTAAVLREDEDATRTKLWFSGKSRMWSDFKNAIHSLKDLQSGTVIIDSGSDLLAMVVASLAIDWQREDKAFPPMLYGQVYGEINAQISFLRQYHHVVLTARIKEKWTGDGNDSRKTGKFEVSIWNTAEYICEHIIRVIQTDKGRLYKTRRYKRHEVSLNESPKWNWLMEGIPQDILDAAELENVQDRIAKAELLFTQKGLTIPTPPKVGAPLDKWKQHLDNLLDLWKKSEAQKADG